MAADARSAAAYPIAALQDEVRLTDTSTVAEVNRVRDRLLLRPCLSPLSACLCLCQGRVSLLVLLVVSGPGLPFGFHSER